MPSQSKRRNVLALVCCWTALTVSGETGGLLARIEGAWALAGDDHHQLLVHDRTLIERTAEGESVIGILEATPGGLRVLGATGIEDWLVEGSKGVLRVTRGGENLVFSRLPRTPPGLEIRLPDIAAAAPVPDAHKERIRGELERRHVAEQAMLKALKEGEGDRARYRTMRHDNTRYVKDLLGEVGWVEAEEFGPRTTYHAFMLIQHSNDLGLMLAAYPHLAEDFEGTEYSEAYALFYDRLQILQGRPQLYGTQMARLPDGQPVVLPLDRPQEVDSRRAEMGLPPLDQYLDLAEQYLFDGKRPRLYGAPAPPAPAADPGSASQ